MTVFTVGCLFYSLGFCLSLTQTSSHKHTPTRVCGSAHFLHTSFSILLSLFLSLFLLHHASIPWWIPQWKGVQSLSPRQRKPFICIAEIRSSHFYNRLAPQNANPLLIYPVADSCPPLPLLTYIIHGAASRSPVLLNDTSLSRHIQIAFVFRTLT